MFLLLAGPEAAKSDVVRRMAARLRGTDSGARLWLDPAREAAAATLKPWFLPEDLHDAQPLANQERLFVCQARLDNRDELIGLLRLRTDVPIADSGILAAAYDRWGADCVHKIVGDYAFAAWHHDGGRIEAAVDPIGAQRLYWARPGQGIALSPQLRPLLAHPDVSDEPNLLSIAKMMDSGIERSSTAYTGLSALPGGHRLVWDRGEVRVERWWRPNWQPTIWYSDPRDYVEELRDLFMSAVKAQLRAAGPISTTLSGGLDSGAVTAAAARLRPPSDGQLTAYTSVPEPGIATSERPGWDSNDHGYAAAVAAAYPSLEHRAVAPGARSVLEVVERVHRLSATPSKNSTNLLAFDRIAEAMIAAGSRVLLLGQQGNSAFSWRGQSPVLELAVLGRWRAALTQAALESRAREIGTWRVHAEAARDAVSSILLRRTRKSGENPGLGFIRESWRVGLGERANEYAEVRGTRRFWGIAVTTPRHVWWPEPATQWGVEFRDPTADRRLIERLLQFPQAAFRAGGQMRGLAREMSKGLLPDPVRLRRTQGAQVPDAAGLIARDRAQYVAALEAMRGTPACRELLDLDALERSVQAIADGRLDHGLAQAVNRTFDVGTFLGSAEHRS